MQTALADFAKDAPWGREADAILRSCVHCGFCLPACPTYRLLGDELDGPRGRIYQIKQLLEGGEAGTGTRTHLDRCLTCRACESACPSGVRYGRLLEIGRAVTEVRVPRAGGQRLRRRLLAVLPPLLPRRPALWGLARAMRPLLPARLAARLPRATAAAARAWPPLRHARRVALLEGCVQPALAPEIDAAAARVLDALGISAIRVPRPGCCGALPLHLARDEEARARARRVIGALENAIEQGAEAVVMTASACAATLRDYGSLLAADPQWSERAARIGALARDIAEVVAAERPALDATLRMLPAAGAGSLPGRIAFQAPCTLQHALRRAGTVQELLAAAGFALTTVAGGQDCCGSAGTYSLLQPQLAQPLLAAKLAALAAGAPQAIATANIGCLLHLRTAATVPVRHWIELLAARLGRG